MCIISAFNPVSGPHGSRFDHLLDHKSGWQSWFRKIKIVLWGPGRVNGKEASGGPPQETEGCRLAQWFQTRVNPETLWDPLWTRLLELSPWVCQQGTGTRSPPPCGLPRMCGSSGVSPPALPQAHIPPLALPEASTCLLGDSGPRRMNAWLWFLSQVSPLGWDFQARPQLLNQLHLAVLPFFGQSQKPSEGPGSSYTETLGQASTAERPASAQPSGFGGWFPWRGQHSEDSWSPHPLPGPGQPIKPVVTNRGTWGLF